MAEHWGSFLKWCKQLKITYRYTSGAFSLTLHGLFKAACHIHDGAERAHLFYYWKTETWFYFKKMLHSVTVHLLNYWNLYTLIMLRKYCHWDDVLLERHKLYFPPESYGSLQHVIRHSLNFLMNGNPEVIDCAGLVHVHSWFRIAPQREVSYWPIG